MFTVNKKNLAVLTLLYLLFPNVLFLWGWFHPLVAISITLAFLVLLFRFCRNHDEILGEEWHLGLKEVIVIAAIFSFIFIKVASSGLIGIFQTHSDIYVFREAFFQNLTKAPWPVVLPDGREMSYYLAGDLPGAFVARLVPFEQHHHVFVTLWASMGFLLATLAFFSCKKRIIWVLPILLFFFCDFINILMALFCRYAEPFFLTHVFHLNTEENTSLFIPIIHDLPIPLIQFFEVSSKYPTAIGRCEMYNSMPYGIATAACIVTSSQYRWLIPLCIVLMLPLSPLFAVGVMPLAAYLFLKDMEWKKASAYTHMFRQLILPCVLAVIYAVYYLRGGSNVTVGFSTINWGVVKTLFYVVNTIAVALFLIYPLRKFVLRDKRILICIACLFTYPLLYAGDLDCNHVNEFWYKTGFTFSFLLAGLFSLYWDEMRRSKYIPVVISICLIPVVLAAIFSKIKTEEFTIADDWNGHIAHDCKALRQHVPGCEKPLIPHLIMNVSGESENHFPGCLLPKAPGCDYSLPPKEKGDSVRRRYQTSPEEV